MTRVCFFVFLPVLGWFNTSIEFFSSALVFVRRLVCDVHNVVFFTSKKREHCKNQLFNMIWSFKPLRFFFARDAFVVYFFLSLSLDV